MVSVEARRPAIDRLDDLWQLLDDHFPGERTEERAFAIDDLHVDLTRHFDDRHGDGCECEMCDW